MRTTTTSYSIGPRTSYFFHVFNLSYKSRGPGQAKPEPSRGWWLWPGLGFQKAKAVPGQAKALAFRPSRAGTTLFLTNFAFSHPIAAAWLHFKKSNILLGPPVNFKVWLPSPLLLGMVVLF